MKRKSTEDTTVVVPVEIRQGVATFNILGKTPLLYNSMSLHVLGQLLIPRGKKTAAEKATKLKHEPLREYRDSVYQRPDEDEGPTRLLLPTRMFKAATVGVARHVPGVAMTALKQLLWIEGDYVDVYGTPMIHMGPVRNSDMKHTPDVRTRAILPRWCCTVSLRFVQPHISRDTLSKYVIAAGVLNGVGDMRQEKGAGNYGQFELVEDGDSRVKQLMKEGLAAQDKALAEPACYDRQTEQLLSLYHEEVARRDMREGRREERRPARNEQEGTVQLDSKQVTRRRSRQDGAQAEAD